MKKRSYLVIIGLLLCTLTIWPVWRVLGNREKVDSYSECVEAGNPIQESFPARCTTRQGKVFVQPTTLATPGQLDKDEDYQNDWEDETDWDEASPSPTASPSTKPTPTPTSTSNSSGQGTIEGKVIIYPPCPTGDQVGIPCVDPKGYYQKTIITISSIDKKRVNIRLGLDSAGKFKIQLNPGSYIISQSGSGAASMDLPKTVNLKAGEKVNLTITLDSGVR